MDYPAPRPVRQALSRLASSGDLGYPRADRAALLEEKWAARMAQRYSWSPAPGHVRVFFDLIQIVQVVTHLATSPGDGVLLFTPAYPPFPHTIESMGRRLLAAPVVDDGTGWSFDMGTAADLAAQAKILLLVNPHNPTGRRLARSELLALGDLVLRHNLIVISDEIHADLGVAGPAAHVPFASLSDELAQRTLTLYSASKSYNLGGMGCAIAHVGHTGLERQLADLPSHLLGGAGVAAVAATLAAWSVEGDAWLERCVARLADNRRILGDWLAGEGAASGVHGYPPEATYLSWLDFRPAGLGADPAAWLLERARVMLSSGLSFGPGGPGFARLNFATSPGLLREILGRISAALGGRSQAAGVDGAGVDGAGA
jgi:cystathionine beta-lyase